MVNFYACGSIFTIMIYYLVIKDYWQVVLQYFHYFVVDRLLRSGLMLKGRIVHYSLSIIWAFNGDGF